MTLLAQGEARGKTTLRIRRGRLSATPTPRILLLLTGLHAAVLLIRPLWPVICVGVWWNSNTIAHNFIHRPFFRSRALNRIFSAVLSVLNGIPQTLWSDRHLAHHRGACWTLRISPQLVMETALVFALWTLLACRRPHFLLFVYLPGYFAGLGLCALQGYWEHRPEGPVSHYGRLYNLLCFNDGYHAEHHAAPGVHWSLLPSAKPRAGGRTTLSSRWPPLLRWLEVRPLEVLEILVLRSAWLQRFVLHGHRRAFRSILAQLEPVHRVAIVGGGLFPRTALLFRELLPATQIIIIDCNSRHLESARKFLGSDATYRNALFVPGDSCDCDLAVIPLCLDGDRETLYRRPPSATVLVHDWIWRRRGRGVIVSLLLLKRINLVQRWD